MPKLTSSQCKAFLVSAFALISSVAHGQQVALLDSGANPVEGTNLVPGFNYIDNTDDTSDKSTREGVPHGTVSALAIAESFNGEVIPFVVVDGDNSELDSELTNARDSAFSDILGRNDVRVIAIARGNPGITGSAAPLLPQLSEANKVIAIMAGNGGSAQPNTLASTSFNLAGVIIVGGTDMDGNLLPSTDRAGTTQNKYVAAIGLPELNSTENGGSSWATARIAGIAGAVFQQNPNLTAAEVVDIILQSAEDRGEMGTDSEYGRGFIANAAQVLNNVIGPVEVPTDSSGGGGGSSGAGAGLLVGGAVAGALLLLRKPKAKLEKTLVLDSYGRTFQVDLSDDVLINDGSLHLSQFFNGFDQIQFSQGVDFTEINTRIAFSANTNRYRQYDMIEYFAMPDDVVIENDKADVSLFADSQLSKSISMSAGYQIDANQQFGAVNELDINDHFGSSSFISGQSFGSVLSGFSQYADTLSFTFSPKKHNKQQNKFSTRLGLVSVNQSERFGQDSFSSILEGNYQFNDNAGVSLQFGQIEEQGSLLGGAAGGIFGVDTAMTYALNVSGHLKATDKFSIVANYGVGKTNVEASSDSLLRDFSSLRSDWYSIGLIGNNVFSKQDQLGVAFSQPLKIRSGYVDYATPLGYNAQGLIEFDVENVNLSDTAATEQKLEGYYRAMLNDKLEFGGFLSYRHNPNHVSDHGDEMIVMATLRYRQ